MKAGRRAAAHTAPHATCHGAAGLRLRCFAHARRAGSHRVRAALPRRAAACRCAAARRCRALPPAAWFARFTRLFATAPLPPRRYAAFLLTPAYTLLHALTTLPLTLHVHTFMRALPLCSGYHYRLRYWLLHTAHGIWYRHFRFFAPFRYAT